jgi:hypothetical protein
MAGVCAVGGAGAIARGFQSELVRYPEGSDQDRLGPRKSRDKTLSNNYNLVVGCTGYHQPPPSYTERKGQGAPQAGRSGGISGGTWLVGDGVGAALIDDAASPKIFADTMPHQTLGRVDDAWDGEKRYTSWARLEPGTTEHAGRFHPRRLVDPDGTEQRWSDANFAYPGKRAARVGAAAPGM